MSTCRTASRPGTSWSAASVSRPACGAAGHRVAGGQRRRARGTPCPVGRRQGPVQDRQRGVAARQGRPPRPVQPDPVRPRPARPLDQRPARPAQRPVRLPARPGQDQRRPRPGERRGARPERRDVDPRTEGIRRPRPVRGRVPPVRLRHRRRVHRIRRRVTEAAAQGGDAPHRRAQEAPARPVPRQARHPADRRHGHRPAPLACIIDECQNLFADPAVGKQAGEDAEFIIKIGRAFGVILLLATQRPDKDSCPPGSPATSPSGSACASPVRSRTT